MSKNPKRLWQRLKQLFTLGELASDKSASSSIADESIAPLNTLIVAQNDDIASLQQHLTHPPVNAAFLDGDDKDTEFGNVPLADDTDAEQIEVQLITPDEIEQILSNMGYQFMYHPASEHDEQTIHHYTMQVSDKERSWGCMIRFFSEQQLIAVYSIYPTSIPEANRPELLVMLTYLNYDLMIGNLEMDVMDGELRFKTSLDLEVTGVNEMIMSYLLQSNFSLFSRLYDTIQEMVEQPHTTNDLQGAVDKLIQSQQSRNFFLVSEAIQ